MQPNIERILEGIINAQSDLLTVIQHAILANSNDPTALEGALEALRETFDEVIALDENLESWYQPIIDQSKATVALALSTEPPTQAPLPVENKGDELNTPKPINAVTGEPVPIATVLPNTL